MFAGRRGRLHLWRRRLRPAPPAACPPNRRNGWWRSGRAMGTGWSTRTGLSYGFGDAGSGPPPTQALLLKPITPGDRAILFALQQLGKPYLFGGDGPNAYDCSGLTYTSWAMAGVGIARVANAQYENGGRARGPQRPPSRRPGLLGQRPQHAGQRLPRGHLHRRRPDRRRADENSVVSVLTVDRQYWFYPMPMGRRP